jgi:hypothetical protein
MTPKEAAHFDSLGNNPEKPKEFLLTASPREIQEFLHNITCMDYNASFHHAKAALDIRLAEDAEKQGKRLIKLTWGLVSVSLALLAFALWQTVILKEDAKASYQQMQAGQNQHPTNNISKKP